MPPTTAAQLLDTWDSDMTPVRTGTACPALTMECCEAGSAWVKMSIPEVVNSHLTPSGEPGVFHPSQWRGDFLVASVTLGEKNSEGNSLALLHRPVTPAASVWLLPALKYRDQMLGGTTGSPSPCESREWNSHSKIRERTGRFLRIISRPHTGGFQWEKRRVCSQFSTRTPIITTVRALWQCYRGQAVRRVSVYGPSYSSVCLRLLGWGIYNVNI